MAEHQTKPFIIGPLVKKARLENELSQLELAKLLGYNYGNFIGMIENGTAKFPRENVLKFAKALRVQPEIFIKAWLEEYQPSWLDHLKINKPSK
ncbi:MAG: helix-turn-helix transcriptional regulator [Desulfobacterales bacterium]|nr:helix-turn-helix transcriptional regulator [Desulfobacterales bacterium]